MFRTASIAFFAIVSPALAANFSFTGNLAGDDDVQLFNFSVGSPSTVTLRTWSYAGGTNAAGTVIPRGGFDPILALFNSAGTLIDQNDDGGANVAPDALTGQRYDTFLQSNLAPGLYTVSVMQFSNFAVGPNLSNGFDGSGTTGFVDVTASVRTSAWAFDILNVGQAEVVVPPTGTPDSGSMLGLVAIAFGAVIAFRRHLRVS